MFESWIDVLVYVGGGAAGGLIYWAARNHGGVFVELWSLISKA